MSSRRPCAARAGCVLAGVLLAGGSWGCSPAPGVMAPAPPVSTAPAGPDGVSLASLGITHAPGIVLPRSVHVVRTIDQPNVVGVFFDAPPASDSAAFLRRSLVAAGFTITADRADSLVFSGPGWTGAFTTNDGLCGLTFRRS